MIESGVVSMNLKVMRPENYTEPTEQPKTNQTVILQEKNAEETSQGVTGQEWHCRPNRQTQRTSAWFSSKFQPDVPVFLNKANSSVNGVVKKWWLVCLILSGIDRCFLRVILVYFVGHRRTKDKRILDWTPSLLNYWRLFQAKVHFIKMARHA